MENLALLRGINVGGNNIIKMTDLKACFGSMSLTDVTTYIQSGNVLFKCSGKNRENLTTRIEKVLSKRFNYKARAILVSHDELRNAVKLAPKKFGKNPAKFRYDVIFLKKPLTASKAIKDISIKEGVDRADAGKDILYFSRLISKAGQSRLARIVQLPMYQHMTIRNWNTTTKLLVLMDARAKT